MQSNEELAEKRRQLTDQYIGLHHEERMWSWIIDNGGDFHYSAGMHQVIQCHMYYVNEQLKHPLLLPPLPYCKQLREKHLQRQVEKAQKAAEDASWFWPFYWCRRRFNRN